MSVLTTDGELKKLVELFHQGKKILYSKGEFIVSPGESPPGIFYIEEGLVKVYDITKYGEENLLVIRKGGDLLGLTWAITRYERPVVYCALKETVIWRTSRDLFISYLRSNPEAALPLVDMITEMYRMHSERILNLEYRTVRERLISFLLTSARQLGKPQKNGSILIESPLRHQDIASSINSSRETTSREMAYLERKGLVRSEQLFITLKDIEALENYL